MPSPFLRHPGPLTHTHAISLYCDREGEVAHPRPQRKDELRKAERRGGGSWRQRVADGMARKHGGLP